MAEGVNGDGEGGVWDFDNDGVFCALSSAKLSSRHLIPFAFLTVIPLCSLYGPTGFSEKHLCGEIPHL